MLYWTQLYFKLSYPWSFHLFILLLGTSLDLYWLVFTIYVQSWFQFSPSQWETALLCNEVSHWLGTSLESALYVWSDHTSDISGFIWKVPKHQWVVYFILCNSCQGYLYENWVAVKLTVFIFLGHVCHGVYIDRQWGIDYCIWLPICVWCALSC